MRSVIGVSKKTQPQLSLARRAAEELPISIGGTNCPVQTVVQSALAARTKDLCDDELAQCMITSVKTIGDGDLTTGPGSCRDASPDAVADQLFESARHQGYCGQWR